MDENNITGLPERLAETFKGETQEITSSRLITTQSNISKWLSGQQTPTTATLYQIAKSYNVSVDWLLGLSDVKEIDGIAFDKITYEQAFRFIDRLMKLKNISLANLAEIIGDEESEYDFGDIDEEDSRNQQEKLIERIVCFPISSVLDTRQRVLVKTLWRCGKKKRSRILSD